MTSFMRKQIAMGVYSLLNVTQNFGLVWPDWPARAAGSPLGTNTRYVRFWVDWTQLAPNGPNNPVTDTLTPLTPKFPMNA